MEVYRGLNELEGQFSRPVIALGNFDGIHLGHKEVIGRLKKRSAEIGGEALVFTFDPHPAKVLRPDLGPSLITILPEKLKVIEKEGVDGIILADFTKEFAAQHPENFVKDILYKTLGANLIIVGHDFTFGKGKKGTIDYLIKIGKELDFNIEVVDAVTVDGEVVSSTRIRELISGGDVKGASKLLGRYYSIEGSVVKGHNRGKSLGYPTANLKLHGELFPGDGVYAVWVEVAGKEMPGVVNAGVKPTFGDEERVVEAHILDFDGLLYGEDLRLLFIDRIRDELRFPGPDELSQQISKDVMRARELLGREKH